MYRCPVIVGQIAEPPVPGKYPRLVEVRADKEILRRAEIVAQHQAFRAAFQDLFRGREGPLPDSVDEPPGVFRLH